MNNLAISYDAGRPPGRGAQAAGGGAGAPPQGARPGTPRHAHGDGQPGDSYDDAGRQEEALKLREQVLALCRKVLGPEHPDTLRAMNNLAISYDVAGRRDEALKLREEVLALRRKVIGPEHPDTLRAMNNLAISYADAGRRDEALKLREEVLALRRKVFGPEHPDTLRAMHNPGAFATTWLAAGTRPSSSRRSCWRSAARCNGPQHPDTLDALNAIAWTLATSDAPEIRNGTKAVSFAEEAVAATHPHERRLSRHSTRLECADATVRQGCSRPARGHRPAPDRAGEEGLGLAIEALSGEQTLPDDETPRVLALLAKFSLTPRLQPGERRAQPIISRFNGLPAR